MTEQDSDQVHNSGKTAVGDQVSGDKVAGDKVAGNKIVNIYQVVGNEDVEKPFDPKIEPPTVLVPAGAFLIGSEEGEGVPENETPQEWVALGDFAVGRFLVTNRFYERFIHANKGVDPPGSWFNRKPPKELLDHPVVDVSWFEAMAYCAWLRKKTGRDYRLPSEAQWEKAAGWAPGEGKRRYPWGDKWEDGRCNVDGQGTTEVTAYEDGASAYGALDMLGNVQEWTRSAWGSSPNEPEFTYEAYDAEDGRIVESADELGPQMRLVYRGGSYRSKPEDVSTTRRGNAAPSSKIAWRGFRVLLEVKGDSS